MERPTSLKIAAGLVLLQALALTGSGLWELIHAFTGHPHDRGTAVLLGVVVLIYALGVSLAARGVWRARRWAQSPSYLVSFFAVVIGLGQVNHLPGLMVPLIAIGAGSFIALSWPASRDALGGI
jgi:cytochrome c biogenesis factor